MSCQISIGRDFFIRKNKKVFTHKSSIHHFAKYAKFIRNILKYIYSLPSRLSNNQLLLGNFLATLLLSNRLLVKYQDSFSISYLINFQQVSHYCVIICIPISSLKPGVLYVWDYLTYLYISSEDQSPIKTFNSKQMF